MAPTDRPTGTQNDAPISLPAEIERSKRSSSGRTDTLLAPWQEFRQNAKPVIATEAREELAARFSGRLVERYDLGRLVGPRHRAEPVYRWVRYKEAFSPALVRETIAYLGIRSGRLLDPFAGVGTSLLVAAELGMEATGVELLPFAAFAGQAMLGAKSASSDLLTNLAHQVARDPRRPHGRFPDFPVRTWAFDEVALAELTRLHQCISALEPSAEQALLRLAFLIIVEEVSQATKDGTSLRCRARGTRNGRSGSRWERAAVRDRFVAKVEEIVADLPHAPEPSNVEIICGDARRLPSRVLAEQYSIALFSPPYPNRYDYTANYQLELGFGFLENREELKRLRRAQLRSHLECSWPERREVEQPALEEFLLAALVSKRPGDQTGRVFRMVAGYFEDMRLVLKELRKAVRPGGHIAMVIGNQVFNGQQLPSDFLLAAIGEDLGMNAKEIRVARQKGVAVQQRERWGNLDSRESILLLEV